MVMRSILATLVASALGACTASSVLSKSVYEHEQHAYELESQGHFDAAAAQRAAAQKDRYRLARIDRSADSPFPRL